MEAPAPSQRWDKICRIYSLVRALPAERRSAVLSQECGGDPDLEREIDLLLNLRQLPPRFLEDLVPDLHASTLPSPSSVQPCCDPGELLNERFQIVRLLGAGGMGQVYEALDKELGEAVAIKILKTAGMLDEHLIQRFRYEIRLSRRITHRNVCRVFDFARHERPDGSALHYYVMELLNGYTLAVRLAKPERLDPSTALDIARQMADGLSAAHDAGIVHRDLKPGNVMLVPTPEGLRVAVTDFGLATRMESRGTTSMGCTGLVLGTPGYVAPEQIYGGPVTRATDVYAYGIVLHELITHIHPRSPEAQHVEIPPNWKAAIDRSMELDPASRFQSVRDAYAALDGRPRFHWNVSRRSFWIGTAITAAGVSLFPVAFRVLQQPPLAEGTSIVVTPVLNTTQESRFDGLTPALQASLTQSARFNIWNIQRLGEVLRSMRVTSESRLETRTWREVAFREKASLVVFSTLSQVGSGFVLSVHLEVIGPTPERPVRSWDASFTSPGPANLFESLHSAAGWIRQTAGEDIETLSLHNRLPQDISSSSWEALELFAHAQTLTSAGRTSEAIPVLRRAIELDPQFAMGCMRLGDILNSQRKSDEGFIFWRKAIAFSKSQRLSEHEQFNIEGRYAIEIGDYRQAEPVLRDWVRKFPNDPLAEQLLGACLLGLGEYSEGLEWANRSEKRFGPTFFGLSTVIRALGVTNRIGEMEARLSAYESVAPPMWSLQQRGIAAALKEDYGQAESYFQKIVQIGSGEAKSRGAGLLAVLEADRGDFEGASKIFEDGLRRDRDSGEHGFASRKAAGLAFLASIRGDRATSRAWALEAVAIQPSPRILTLIASTLCRAGFIDDARQLIAEFPKDEGPRFEAARLRMSGELAAAQSNFKESLNMLERCVRIESSMQPKEYLAYVLHRAGQPERARLLYRQIATTPYLIWDSPDSEWPGIRFLAKRQLSTR